MLGVSGPSSATEGDTVSLACRYDLGRDAIYSIKWYKDRHEVYRYVPTDTSDTKVFSSPGVGAMYGIEVPFRRDLDAPRLVPAAVAAGASFATHSALVGARRLVTLAAEPEMDRVFVLGCVLTALGCGLGARLFALATDGLRRLGARLGPWPRALIGSTVLAALAWTAHALSGAWITFGPGYFAADWLADSRPALWLLGAMLLVRTAGTLTCVFGAGGGGVFTSLAITGAFVGEVIAQAIGRTASNALPILGAATFLGAGYRIPLAGVLLVAESTGDLALTVAGLASVGIGQALMGDASVSDAQRDRRGAAPPAASDQAPEADIRTAVRRAPARRRAGRRGQRG